MTERVHQSKAALITEARTVAAFVRKRYPSHDAARLLDAMADMLEWVGAINKSLMESQERLAKDNALLAARCADLERIANEQLERANDAQNELRSAKL